MIKLIRYSRCCNVLVILTCIIHVKIMWSENISTILPNVILKNDNPHSKNYTLYNNIL